MATADTNAADRMPTNRRWVIFSLAAGTSFILYLHRYTWQFVRPELMKEYGFSNTEVDTLYTLFNVSYGLGQIPGGVVCDLFGPHLFLGIIIAAWSVALSRPSSHTIVAVSSSLNSNQVPRCEKSSR